MDYTVCYVVDRKLGRILLGLKKLRIGKGLWNGFGGHLEPDETIEQCAVRELKAESGLRAATVERLGLITVIHPTEEGEDELDILHIFLTEEYTGVVQESDEMTPQWFPLDDIPYRQMWPDQQATLPFVLQCKKFQANFHYGKNNTVHVKKVQQIPFLPPYTPKFKQPPL